MPSLRVRLSLAQGALMALICATGSHAQNNNINGGTSQGTVVRYVDISPRATYLRTNKDQASPAVAIDLKANGFKPGDKIELREYGSYYRTKADAQAFKGRSKMAGVFSTSNIILASNRLNRVPGAVPSVPLVPITTPKTAKGNIKTDIPQDFPITDTTVVIPDGAAFLFVTAVDSYFRDNTAENHSFGVALITVPVMTPMCPQPPSCMPPPGCQPAPDCCPPNCPLPHPHEDRLDHEIGRWHADGDALDYVGLLPDPPHVFDDGTLVGGVTYAPGKIGQAFSFSGMGQYVNIPIQQPWDLVNGWTLAAYVSPFVYPNRTALIAGVPGLFGIGLDPGNIPFAITAPAINAGTGWNAVGPKIPLRQYTHLIATWDAATGDLKLYQNGTLTASTPSPVHNIDPGSIFQIGGINGNGDSGYFFDGQIDDIHVFDSALTPDEIAGDFTLQGALDITAGGGVLSIDSGLGTPGGTAVVDIRADDKVTGLAGLKLTVTFPTDLQIADSDVDVSDSILASAQSAVNTTVPGQMSLIFAGTRNVSGPGVIARLTFHVPSTAMVGDLFNVDLADATANDSSGQSTRQIPTVGGLITVPGPDLGDLNHDGVVNIADATLALRAAVGLIQLTPDQIDIADTNDDGVVGAADVTQILALAVGIPLPE